MEQCGEEEVNVALAGLEGWRREGDELVLVREHADFRTAMGWLVRVAFEAEALNHHPSVRIDYGRVELRVCTHDAGDVITALDLRLAEAVSGLA